MYGEKKYAEVVLLELNLDKIFHYHIPESFRKDILCGTRVLIPFKNKKVIGCVIGFLAETAVQNLKDIEEVLDDKPLLNSTLLKLTRWISDYYLCSQRIVLSYVLPKIKHRIDIDSDLPDRRTPSSLYSENFFENFKFLNENLTPLLLITKDSKQRIDFYFQCIQKTLEKGKKIIILTPTESHLSRLIEVFREKYGERLVFFPENIKMKDKFKQWLKIKNSMVDIALGMRSTIFVPFDQLGLIIVDEEHNGAYKEERTPRYNAKDVALKRAELEGIPIILSSETPSLETYYKATQGEYRKLDLCLDKEEERKIDNILIDMNQEKIKKKLVSYELQESIWKSLKRGKKVVLFLNKRGFSSFVVCNRCGFIPRCSDCNRTLSYYLEFFNQGQLICYYCQKKMSMPKVCSNCGNKDIKPRGIGTQRLEGEIKKMFPRARIWRADQDTIQQKNQYSKFWKEMKEGNIDILIGTLRTIKNLNFQDVDLLGIVSADTLLNLPDFRSAERNFQLLSEVISSVKDINFPIKIIIQTFNPDHYSIIALKKQNFEYFYQREIKTREELSYPPFTHLIKIEVQGKGKEEVEEEIGIIIDYFNSLTKKNDIPLFQLLGSKNIQLSKFRKFFQAQLFIKVKEIESFNRFIKEDLEEIGQDYFLKRNKLTIDVDPLKLW